MKLMMWLLLLCSISTWANEWREQQIDPALSFRGSAAADGTFWVSGSNNSVFFSNDAGSTWQDVSVKGQPLTDFRDIAVFDKNTAIVMGAGEGELSRLYLTEDQGASWQLLLQNTANKGFFNSISFWDRNNGLLFGDPVDGYFVLLRTSDGGKTWQRIKQSGLPALRDKEVAFAASGNTLVTSDAGHAWFVTGGYSSAMYTSQDFGAHWQRTATPLYSDTQTAGGYGIAINSLNEVFALGGDYKQRDKQDANISFLQEKKWRLAHQATAGLRTAMVCHQATCIATGKRATDISFDHGHSWQAPDINQLKQGYYSLAIDNNTAVAAGHNGRVAVFTLPQSQSPSFSALD